LGLSASGKAVARRAMEEARNRGAKITFDVNYRQRLWDPAAAAAAVREVAELLDVVICTAEDARDLFGGAGAPEVGVERLRAELGAPAVVLTLGSDGAIASSDAGRVA